MPHEDTQAQRRAQNHVRRAPSSWMTRTIATEQHRLKVAVVTGMHRRLQSRTPRVATVNVLVNRRAQQWRRQSLLHHHRRHLRWCLHLNFGPRSGVDSPVEDGLTLEVIEGPMGEPRPASGVATNKWSETLTRRKDK